MNRCVSSLLCWIVFIVLPPSSPAQAPVDYSRDIRPILAGSCYTCHGPDEGQRKGKLRLDLRNEAIKKAIVPGNAADSALFQRIVSKESEEVMPPPHSKRPAVTPEQAKLIERWIQEGAKYDMHWAYVKPVSTPIPGNKNEGWIRTPVDAFIAAEHAVNLHPKLGQ